MGLFRRREPLHEQLAREGADRRSGHGAASAWVDGNGRPRRSARREWDAVVTVEADGVEGDRPFVALSDDTLVVEEGTEVGAIADALDDVVQPPYRAEATRRGESRWAVGPGGPGGRAAGRSGRRRGDAHGRGRRADAGRRRAAGFGSIPSSRRSGRRGEVLRGAGQAVRRIDLGGRGPAAVGPAAQRLPCIRGRSGSRRFRESTPRRRGPACQAARRAGGLHHVDRGRLPEALRRRAARQDLRVPPAAGERRTARGAAVRGVRRSARGAPARVRPAHVRRS